jgi:dynein heavy chain, axonemal
MQNAPQDIEKLKGEILANVKVYEILEGFQYKFTEDEDYERRWQLFGSPKDTFERIAKQGDNLDRVKDNFVSAMKSDQSQFEQANVELSTVV